MFKLNFLKNLSLLLAFIQPLFASTASPVDGDIHGEASPTISHALQPFTTADQSCARTEEEAKVRSIHNAKTGLLSLPRELLEKIVNQLGRPQDVDRFGATCHKARKIFKTIMYIGIWELRTFVVS